MSKDSLRLNKLWRNRQGGSGSTEVEASSVVGLSEAIDDRVNSLLVAGTNVSLDYEDGDNTLTINVLSSASTRVTLDAPSNSFGEAVINVIDVSATASSKVNCKLVLNSATDQNGIEELVDMQVYALAKLGSIDFFLTKPSWFVGPFYVDYSLT